MARHLTLGTAKLGLPDYGFPSTHPRMDSVDFIRTSIEHGIDFIDTSPRYGDSEIYIGKAVSGHPLKPKISTKIDGLRANFKGTPAEMRESIERSVERLKAPIEICYLHQNEIEIISDDFVLKGLLELKEENLVSSIGTSVYSQEELQFSLDCGLFDCIQIPVNILDTSFYDVAEAHAGAVKVAVRSVFLQGLIFRSDQVQTDATGNTELSEQIQQLQGICKKLNLTLQQLSVAYLSAMKSIDQIIVGTVTEKNLLDNIASTKIALTDESVQEIQAISRNSKPWSNPRHWNL